MEILFGQGHVAPTGGSSLNYRAIFTGEVFALPLRFNPTQSEVIKLKKLSEKAAVIARQEVYVTDNYTKLSLLCRFNPNFPMNPYSIEKVENTTLPSEMYFTKDVIISSKLKKNTAGDKVVVIDGRLNSTYVPFEEGKTAAELVRQCQSTSKDNISLNQMNLSNVRFAREGEVETMQLLFDMTSLNRYREQYEDGVDKAGKAYSKGDKVPGTEDNFVLPEGTWDRMIKGDVSYINEVFFTTDFVKNPTKEQLPVGFVLSVRESESNGTTYYNQTTVQSNMMSCTFKSTRPYVRSYDIPGVGQFNSNLSPNVVNALYGYKSSTKTLDDKYAYKNPFSIEFKLYVPGEKTVETKVQKPAVEEGLPF